ncbi:MAG: ABC transporter permease [Gammaproteobacteria bacterium]
MAALLDPLASDAFPPAPGGWRRFWRSLLRNPAGVIGLVLVLGVLLLALLAPLIAPFDPLQMGAGKRLLPPGGRYWFGTDEFGRDLFSRVAHGSRLTLRIGVIAVAISLACGLLIGLLAGYAGGWTERILMRAIDVLFSFTEILIALACVAILGPSLANATLAVGIAAIPFYARLTHSVVLVEKHKLYFEAGQAVAASHLRLLFRHLLPNVLPALIVVATLGVSTAVLAAAGLSFLGLGAQPPLPEWGFMLSSGRDLFKRAPWIMIFPGAAIAVTVLGFNLLGDAIREALDPRQYKA